MLAEGRRTDRCTNSFETGSDLGGLGALPAMSDEEDGGAGALASKPEVEWLFGRITRTLRCKSALLAKMKQDESCM